ncbi:hypothetical protein EDD36DRAFT_426106 [Exophiala viscosa]|uniref:C2H2-type domain-containing protein n=1 Tax=Exophiala viscosa TaxID=2486360 RepID=A0AAN6E5L5_9EURO|nr:hypothetical protein EDD36DRAFT_426106 [Exophiala viscosa]
MASSTMAPPPTPLAHRRTHRLISKNLPPSPPASPESSKCSLRKMSLSKGATFHCSSLPSTRDDPVLSIPHLTHRSPTFSQSLLTGWLSEKEDVAQSIADFEETFSGARGKRGAGRRRSLRDFEQQVLVRRAALPSDEGLGSSISPASDKGLAKTFERALDLLSSKDSGLGTSISDSVEKVVGNNSEEDGLAKDLIQGWIARCVLMCEDVVNPSAAEADSSDLTTRRLRQRPIAVTQSIAPQPSRTAPRHPPLNNSARNKLKEHILLPILRDDRFEEFHPFVSTLGSKTNKNIRCLRDLEKSLIFKPLTFAISRHLFRLFGEFTIQLVVDTYQHLSESEQRRAADRAYDNGYFLDLVQQVNRLATQIGSSNRVQQAGTAEDDEMAYSIDDEVTLEGGLGESGNQAELVRWKNGKGISLRTGQPYVPAPGIKRQSSGELDEDVARSMARRKKGWVPDNVQMKCHDPECDKTFTRKCDLAKHEKTHSRPFKCPEETCKYHDLGLPTEKERERHYNDKHSKDPHFYKCDFCEFRTKRESNCKQHQEKKHGWVYERAKGKDKAAAGSSRMTPAETPQTYYSPSLRSHDDASSVAGSIRGSYAGSIEPSFAGSVPMTPVEQPVNNFDTYQPAPVSYSNPLFPRQTPSMPYNTVAEEFDFNSASFQQPYSYQPAQTYISPTNTTPISSHNLMGTPITPAYSNITEPSDYAMPMDLTMDCTNPTMWNDGLPTPSSYLQPQSRNPSISEYSPMIAGPSTEVFHKASIMDQALGFPEGDFSLFGGESSNAFSNPAAASATLFPGGPEAFATLDNDPMFNENWTDEDLFDYDMGN